MKTAQYIREQVEAMPAGMPFGYTDLKLEPEAFLRAAKALERLCSAGVVQRIAKGMYVRLVRTRYGRGGMDYNELMKRLQYCDGKRVAYITGYVLFNDLKLTTQVPARIRIAGKQVGKKKFDYLKVDMVKSVVPVNDENAVVLQVLDVLRDITQVPDGDINISVMRMRSYIYGLSIEKQALLKEIALAYPPRVRALLGAIMDKDALELKKSLNPFTVVKLPISEKTLPNKQYWNIR